MKSVVEKLSPTRVKCEVIVGFGELKPYRDKVLKQLTGQMQVPGFRAGKVPKKLVEQRVGRQYVTEQAIGEGIDDFYQQVLAEQKLFVLDSPEVETKSIPDNDSDDFEFAFEVDVRPDVKLPVFGEMELTVDDAPVDDSAAEEALDDLRSRFGTLKSVDRVAADDDFVAIDLLALVGDEEVDEAKDLSYQIGSGTMLEGMDKALIGLKVGEEKTFMTKLSGGEHSGKEADVTVTLRAVKERELPAVDDDFAQLASEFETVVDLKADLEKKAEHAARIGQGVQARDAIVDKLVADIEVAVPEDFIDKQVDKQFASRTPDGENREQADEQGQNDDDERQKMREELVRQFKQETILEVLADEHDVKVSQSEIIEYATVTAKQYGVEPRQFITMLNQSGQLPLITADIRRRKAIAAVLKEVTVKDKTGSVVDLSVFLDGQLNDNEDS